MHQRPASPAVPPLLPHRYPTRNELTGGFAGGELGLSVFKEKGDVPIAPNGQGTKQSSPLITAFVLGLAATGGGLLLSTIEEVGVSVVENGAPAINATASLGLDEKTKVFLTVSTRIEDGHSTALAGLARAGLAWLCVRVRSSTRLAPALPLTPSSARARPCAGRHLPDGRDWYRGGRPGAAGHHGQQDPVGRLQDCGAGRLLGGGLPGRQGGAGGLKRRAARAPRSM